MFCFSPSQSNGNKALGNLSLYFVCYSRQQQPFLSFHHSRNPNFPFLCSYCMKYIYIKPRFTIYGIASYVNLSSHRGQLNASTRFKILFPKPILLCHPVALMFHVIFLSLYFVPTTWSSHLCSGLQASLLFCHNYSWTQFLQLRQF
jgi:hypothetical protein